MKFGSYTQSVVIQGRGSARRKAVTYTGLGQTYIPRVGFEPIIPVFEWAKTFCALDRAAIVVGYNCWLPPHLHFIIQQ
jgi:hypothetical protein